MINLLEAFAEAEAACERQTPDSLRAGPVLVTFKTLQNQGWLATPASITMGTGGLIKDSNKGPIATCINCCM
jgi:hypothetical protein